MKCCWPPCVCYGWHTTDLFVRPGVFKANKQKIRRVCLFERQDDQKRHTHTPISSASSFPKWLQQPSPGQAGTGARVPVRFPSCFQYGGQGPRHLDCLLLPSQIQGGASESVAGIRTGTLTWGVGDTAIQIACPQSLCSHTYLFWQLFFHWHTHLSTLELPTGNTTVRE